MGIGNEVQTKTFEQNLLTLQSRKIPYNKERKESISDVMSVLQMMARVLSFMSRSQPTRG